MKVKVPGVADSTGVKAVDFTLPACKQGEFYVFELGEPKSYLSERSPCMVNSFPMVVLDGPDDPKTGKSTAGRKYTHRINVLLEDHPSYDASNTRNADELADLCAACGVEVSSSGEFETEDFTGKKVKAKLGVRQGKDADGTPRPENTVQVTKGEDGQPHLWLADDGRPAGRSPAKKSATAKRR